MVTPLNKRFISAFREIEAVIAPGEGSARENFRDAVYRQIGDGILAADEARDLDELYVMRNLLTHFGVDGQDVFEVSPAAVRRMEQIRNKLTTRAPTVAAYRGKVLTIGPDAPMSQAAATMAKHDYSCLPVYADGHFCGTLDADIIMHWVGDALTDPALQLLEDAKVGEIRGRYPEPAVEFCRPDALQRDVAWTFERAMRQSTPLVAVLITGTGHRNGGLKGIITPWDVPGLRD